jgi:hypothetical protein
MLIKRFYDRIDECMFLVIDSNGKLAEIADIAKVVNVCVTQVAYLEERLDQLEKEKYAAIKNKKPRILQKKCGD